RELGLHVLPIAEFDEIPPLLDGIGRPGDETPPDVRVPLHLVREPSAPASLLDLGVLLARLHDVDGAETVLARARESGDVDIAAAATRNLGVLRLEHGDVPGAVAAFEATIALDHPDQTPRALVDLGAVLVRLGEVDAARALFERAAASRHEVWAGA